ncbi:MAG: right-handed parallel beta-helix repeat-containing protein, partial [Actinomycetes bacterium]
VKWSDDVMTAKRTDSDVTGNKNVTATFVEDAPTVLDFSPTSGPAKTVVTITGTGFTSATGVTFNGTAATSFTVDSATQIKVSVPAGNVTGFVAATNPSGTGTSVGTYTRTATTWNVPADYSTIQAAVTAATSGDTIDVAAGTYAEQLNITKALTLTGAGAGTTHLQAPAVASMAIYDQFGSKSPTARYSVHRATDIAVVRIAASDVTVEGFHVDLMDYAYWNVKGSYGSNYSRSVGILVDHTETVPGTPDVFTGVSIRNNLLDGFLLNDNGDGIKVLARATASVTGNTIYAYGEQGISAQAPDYPAATYHPTVTANNNVIYGGTSGRGEGTGTSSFFGIGYWVGADGSATGNTIHNYPDWSVGGPGMQVWGTGATSVTFASNVIDTDGGAVGGHGIDVNDATAVCTGNTITHQEYGVYLWQDPGTAQLQLSGGAVSNNTVGVYSEAGTVASVHGTSLTGNGLAIDASSLVGSDVNATGNYWGAASGPYNATTNPTGTGNPVTDHVTFDPWLLVPSGSWLLQYNAGSNGSIEGSTTQVVLNGASGTEVEAKANAGYHFVKWSDDVMTAKRT